MKFSIVTPSFRHAEWLKLCLASVADQSGVEREHIVQDAGSDDGTLDWLPHDPRVKAFVERDDGMYDAINRGFRRAEGELLSYLNCDEQYLPGALQRVAACFAAHPETDVVLTRTIFVDTEGRYVCHRYPVVPRKFHLWFAFPIVTCSVFYRRRILDRYEAYFDTRWRALGDLFWFMNMVEKRVPMRILPEFTSVFTITGKNLIHTPASRQESATKRAMAPAWCRRLRPGIVLHHRLRVLASGCFWQRPFSYELYTRQSPGQRVVMHAERPTARLQGRY